MHCRKRKTPPSNHNLEIYLEQSLSCDMVEDLSIGTKDWESQQMNSFFCGLKQKTTPFYILSGWLIVRPHPLWQNLLLLLISYLARTRS